MKKKDVLVKSCLFVLFILILGFVFLTSMAYQVFDYCVPHVIGVIPWILIYFVLPAAVLILLCVLCIFRKKMLPAWVCLAVYILIAGGTLFTIHGYISTFTTEKWEKYKQDRYYMLDDFQEKYELETMTKDEVLVLLGKPDSITDGEFNYVVDTGWIDPIIFYIYFDENGMVSGYHPRYENIKELR